MEKDALAIDVSVDNIRGDGRIRHCSESAGGAVELNGDNEDGVLRRGVLLQIVPNQPHVLAALDQNAAPEIEHPISLDQQIVTALAIDSILLPAGEGIVDDLHVRRISSLDGEVGIDTIRAAHSLECAVLNRDIRETRRNDNLTGIRGLLSDDGGRTRAEDACVAGGDRDGPRWQGP